MITYRPFKKGDEREKISMMSSYRQSVGEESNPRHKTKWPLGVIEDQSMNVNYIGAFDGNQLVGIIGYTKMYHTGRNLFHFFPRKKLWGVFEVMLFVRQDYSGRGIGLALWKKVAVIASGMSVPLLVGNNTAGGEATLKKAVGAGNVENHILSVVPFQWRL